MLLESQAGMLIVGEASTGRQAIEMAQELQPDIILMDVTLPDISGVEATREIQQDRLPVERYCPDHSRR